MYDNRLSSFNTMTAIIVEDDVVIRNSLSRILGLYFKRVIEAQDGEKALEFFESRDIHIAFLDIDIPLVNGLEVAAFMREQERERLISDLIISISYKILRLKELPK